jgi:hypothetical protein
VGPPPRRCRSVETDLRGWGHSHLFSLETAVLEEYLLIPFLRNNYSFQADKMKLLFEMSTGLILP